MIGLTRKQRWKRAAGCFSAVVIQFLHTWSHHSTDFQVSRKRVAGVNANAVRGPSTATPDAIMVRPHSPVLGNTNPASMSSLACTRASLVSTTRGLRFMVVLHPCNSTEPVGFIPSPAGSFGGCRNTASIRMPRCPLLHGQGGLHPCTGYPRICNDLMRRRETEWGTGWGTSFNGASTASRTMRRRDSSSILRCYFALYCAGNSRAWD